VSLFTSSSQVELYIVKNEKNEITSFIGLSNDGIEIFPVTRPRIRTTSCRIRISIG